MSSPIYNKPYSKGEWKFEIEIPTPLVDNFIMVKTLDCDIEFEAEGAFFAKTDGTGTVIPLRIDAEQLETNGSGGIEVEIGVDFFRANLDLTLPNQEINCIEAYKDDVGTPLVFDRTNALNILRSEGEATKGVVSFNPNLNFRYRLKRNTTYLIICSVLQGASLGTTKGTLFGTIREVN